MECQTVVWIEPETGREPVCNGVISLSTRVSQWVTFFSVHSLSAIPS